MLLSQSTLNGETEGNSDVCVCPHTQVIVHVPVCDFNNLEFILNVSYMDVCIYQLRNH